MNRQPRLIDRFCAELACWLQSSAANNHKPLTSTTSRHAPPTPPPPAAPPTNHSPWSRLGEISRLSSDEELVRWSQLPAGLPYIGSADDVTISGRGLPAPSEVTRGRLRAWLAPGP